MGVAHSLPPGRAPLPEQQHLGAGCLDVSPVVEAAPRTRSLTPAPPGSPPSTPDCARQPGGLEAAADPAGQCRALRSGGCPRLSGALGELPVQQGTR